jgi:hypothetical protein
LEDNNAFNNGVGQVKIFSGNNFLELLEVVSEVSIEVFHDKLVEVNLVVESLKGNRQSAFIQVDSEDAHILVLEHTLGLKGGSLNWHWLNSEHVLVYFED